MTDFKHLAYRISHRFDRYRPPQRPAIRPFAEAAPFPPENDDGNADVLTWRLMAPSTRTLH